MRSAISTSSVSLLLLGLLFTCATACAEQLEVRSAPLAIEPIGVVKTLPEVYPERWFLVQDSAFLHMSDGKVYVIDASADTVPKQIKGTFNISLMGNLVQSARNQEIYATETFHSRGTRGVRTDVLTVWDMPTLKPVAEVILPTGKRFMGMPTRHALLLLNDSRWLAIANFAPATSITLVDLKQRKIIGEIATPGCSFVYPNGPRGFSSLCADGRFMSTQLNKDGGLDSQVRTDTFFSSDDTPIFERPAIIGDTAYFPSFAGLVHPVSVKGPTAAVSEPWNLVPADDKQEQWAPSGIGIIDQDELGRFYVLMHSGAADGSQNGGGSEVWVFDPKTKTRVQRIALQQWGLSIAISSGDEPWLMVTNPVTMVLEVYDALSGKYIKTITDLGQETPLLVHGTR